jgi:hypothetical protein
MDTPPASNTSPETTAPILPATANMICPQCHQPVLPTYYFCPNCGKKLEDAPLSTSIGSQIWLYFFSLIIMPVTCYLIYTRWQGIKYFKSKDPKAHQMGLIAIILLVASFGFIVWSTFAGIAWVQGYVQTEQTQLNNIGGI